MDEMIKGLMEKVGLDEAKANLVFSFLKDNATKIPGWLGGSLDTIKDTVGDALGVGGDEDLFAGIKEQIDDARDD